MQKQSPPVAFEKWATHAICSEMLEHVDDPSQVLENVGSFMAPGCQLVVTLPSGPMSYFDHYIGHRKHFKARELRDLLEQTGYHVESVWRAGFPFMNLYKLVVIARGKALVRDVATQADGHPSSRLATAVMNCFRFLFRGNLTNTIFGWQLVAIARKK